MVAVLPKNQPHENKQTIYQTTEGDKDWKDSWAQAGSEPLERKGKPFETARRQAHERISYDQQGQSAIFTRTSKIIYYDKSKTRNNFSKTSPKRPSSGKGLPFWT